MMDRREFIQTTIGMVGLTAILGEGTVTAKEHDLMTVEGPILSDRIGVALPHEHILADFIGADKASRDRYDPDEVFRIVLPHLQRARDVGIATLFECTPAYLGRDIGLLKRLAAATGLHIVTNTGYYGAANDKFLPAHAFTETADQLAERWIGEWRDGIEGAGVRPGFIKTGVDPGTLSEVDRKLVRAAARTHLATGLTIASHTGDGKAVLEELTVLAEEGVDGTAFIWVHAQAEPNAALRAKAAERGAWIEFDGIAPQTVDHHVKLVCEMKDRGLLRRVLVSHDAGWYHVGEPAGGVFRPFDTLVTQFIPALKKGGLTDEDIEQLTVKNPREAFAVRVRRREEATQGS
jgi:phosphotriesterase-related protein